VVECLSCWLDGENRSGRAQSIKIKIGTGRGRSTRPEWGSQTSTCSEKATEGGALRSVLARAPLARAGSCESGEDRSRDCAVSALLRSRVLTCSSASVLAMQARDVC
jgi:hypothetical protein